MLSSGKDLHLLHYTEMTETNKNATLYSFLNTTMCGFKMPQCYFRATGKARYAKPKSAKSAMILRPKYTLVYTDPSYYLIPTMHTVCIPVPTVQKLLSLPVTTMSCIAITHRKQQQQHSIHDFRCLQRTARRFNTTGRQPPAV